MNVRGLITAVILGLLGAWAVEYVLFGKKQIKEEEGIRAGQVFVAPKTERILRPLQVEVDFADEEKRVAKVVTAVETAQAYYRFSNYGGCLEYM
ncbi:MAG: hypothetical protein WBQ73_01005, partial [Candidatus Babeliales bacterium]